MKQMHKGRFLLESHESLTVEELLEQAERHAKAAHNASRDLADGLKVLIADLESSDEDARFYLTISMPLVETETGLAQAFAAIAAVRQAQSNAEM